MLSTIGEYAFGIMYWTTKGHYTSSTSGSVDVISYKLGINVGEWLGINKVRVCIYRSRIFRKQMWAKRSKFQSHDAFICININKLCCIHIYSSYYKHLQMV